jgi:Copper binding proteins, plastocyanin/azurin family
VFAALALAGGAAADNPTLFGTVGPGFSIRVADGAGSSITRIPPGTYTVKVSDLAAVHNFHLTGPGGFDMSTTVEGTGTAEWTVTFQVGTYHYQCDPHSGTMKGDITVEAGAPLPTPGTTTTTTTTPAPAPAPAKRPVLLTARVTGAAISLKTLGDRKVGTLKAGPVAIGVSDLSAMHNFHLIGPGVNRMTTRSGKVKVSWRLTLKRGRYVYRSDAAPLRLRGTFRVV